MELNELVDMMNTTNQWVRIANNPLAQLGRPNRQYLGATLLPERNVPTNTYKEEYIQYRTNIANAGTRYSPPQLKQGVLVGSMTVELAESDIAAEFKPSDYDALIRILQQLPNVTSLAQVPPQAMTSLINWADTNLNLPLVEFNEKNRWDAMVAAQVQLRGDNGFAEDVNYSDPAGHRVNAGGSWADPTYDPYPDIVAGYHKLLSKGYAVSRMVCSLDVKMALLTNPKILTRLGFLSIAGGAVVGLAGIGTLDQLNARFAQDGLPNLQTYDLQYRTQTGTTYFLPRNVFVMCATTGRDAEIDFGDNKPFQLPDTLGYVGVGTPANRPTPGRAIRVEYNDGKGAPVKGQSWQTSLPVIENPEAIYVIKNITTV